MLKQAATSTAVSARRASTVARDYEVVWNPRLERDEPERLVDRRHHAQVGDAVERVQRVVARPAEERAVLREPQLARLRLQVGLGRAGPGDDEAHLAEPLDHARQCLECEME